MTEKLRKHYVAFIALGAFHFIFFFPLAFMGRVVSPNDVFYQYEPWASYRPQSLIRVQNPLMNDPPTAYMPLMSLVKGGEWSAFHWNPYVGGGIPGFGSSAAAILSPFILLPSLTVPASWLYTTIIFLKLNVAFVFAYMWLREERFGKRASAIGAIIIAGAGIYSVRWLWQMTNATALYPALLWIIRRAFAGKRTSIAVMALIALAFALSGFPSAMAYGAWLALAYAIFLAIRFRRFPTVRIAEGAIAVVLALLAAAPSIVPFIDFLRRSGYLELRTRLAAISFPLHHWRSFFDPQRLGNPGNPGERAWTGDAALGMLNNFIEATVYVGLLAIPLIALAFFRRHRTRWFWVAVTVILLCCMFGVTVIPKWIGALPGFRYTALSRTSLLLPVAIGFLAANGAALLFRWTRRGRRVTAGIVAALAAADLALFAGVFYPYMPADKSAVPVTPVIDFLRNDPAPYRFVGFLSYMWPNSAELYRIEDLASHFGSEALYRRLLFRIDPTSWSGTSTVIQFNSLRFNFTDPFVSMLGVRYFLEHRPIDIIKWTTFAATVPGVKQTGSFTLPARTLAQRTIVVDAEPFWAIELPVSVDAVTGARPRLDVELLKGGATVWSRSFIPSDISAMHKVYIPMRPYARMGEAVALRVWSTGMRVGLLRADARPGEAPIFYGRVTIPLVFDRELPDGRVFRNLAEVPRFQAVKRVRKLNDTEFMYARGIDPSEEAVITDDPVFPPDGIAQDGRVELVRYQPDEQRMVTTASGPLFLASSEKLTPELRITIDGKRAKPVRINTLFAGVTVPAGRHEVVFSRRIGRGWWVPSILALVAIAVIAVLRR